MRYVIVGVQTLNAVKRVNVKERYGVYVSLFLFIV